jgi:hypothetical protein
VIMDLRGGGLFALPKGTPGPVKHAANSALTRSYEGEIHRS